MIDLEGMYDLRVHPAPSIQRRKFSAVAAIKLDGEERMAGLLHGVSAGIKKEV
jgi:hypothetical protein